MRHPRWAAQRALAAVGGLAMVVTLPAGIGSAAPGQSSPGPVVRLVAAQRSITVPRNGDQVYLDPGVYVEALGSALEFLVGRASYAKPVTITEVIRTPDGGTVRRPLPAWVLDGWTGLRRFLRITIRNAHGKIAGASVLPFCPDSANPQRARPDSPARSPFPLACDSNPFEIGTVWGLQRGWAADPFGSGPIIVVGGRPRSPSPSTAAGAPASPAAHGYKLRLGRYQVTVSITRLWRRLLHVTARDATASVSIKVVKGSGCVDICPPRPRGPGGRPAAPRTLPRLPAVPAMADPPAADLPDLIPLPSYGIGVDNSQAHGKHPQSSYLSFAATVWIGGNSRFDVEGFRTRQSPTMKAYQYFWHGNRVVGRTRAGTMGFGGKWGRGGYRWHFAQWARFRLLDASKSVVRPSHKVGFCIEPTDAIDLLLRHSAWQPPATGPGGACGSRSAMWVQEMLPLGWGDTYVCSGSQSFDISKLPNGTYYIEVIANPEHVIHETDYGNDVSLRKVILGGTPGHRTVAVPAYHGIDQER